MPTTELLGAKQVGAVTGKAFTVTSAGAGKGVILTPLVTTGSKAGVITHQVILKTAEVEGLTGAGAVAKAAGTKTATAAGKTVAIGKTTVAGKVAATKGVVPTLVEIEGAGKVVGVGAGKGGTAINSIQLSGVLQPGAKGSQVLLQGGEAKIASGPLASKAAAMGKTAAGAKGAAITKGAVGTAAVGGAATAAAGQTTAQAGATSVTGATGAEVVTSSAGGTIWTGKGFSLGRGGGLGAGGPVLLAGGLAAVGVGIYSYLKREQGGELEEVIG